MQNRMRTGIAAIVLVLASAISAEAMMLGSASRSAGTQLLAKVETVSGPKMLGERLCRRILTGCLVDGLPEASPRFAARLSFINRTGNAQSVPGQAMRTYWPKALQPVTGEAAARAKRDRLLVDGVPAAALQLTVIADDAGKRMVLFVETTTEAFVLDGAADVVRQSPVDHGTTASIPSVRLPSLRFR